MADDIKIRVGVQNNVKAGMNSAVRDVKASTSGMSGAFKSILGGVGFGMVISGIRNLISSVSDLKDQADQVDFSPRNFQILKAVAEDSGVGADKLTAALGRMMNVSANIGQDKNAQKAFAALGISIDDVIASNPEQLFQKIANGLAKTGDKAAIFDIFGRGAAQLIPTLRELGGGFDALASKGGIVKDEDLKRLDELDDKINKITRTLKGWGATAASVTVNAVTGFVEKVAGRLGAMSAGGSPLDADRMLQAEADAKAKKDEQAKLDKQAEDEHAAQTKRDAYYKQLAVTDMEKRIKDAKELQADEAQQKNENVKDDAVNKQVEAKNWKVLEEQAGKKQSLVGRLMGKSDRNAAQEADRASKIALDDDFRKQERDSDRQQKRQESRAEKLLKRASDPAQRKRSPQLQRLWDADLKQKDVQKFELQAKQREQDAWQAQIDAARDAALTATHTREIRDIEKELLTLKGGQ